MKMRQELTREQVAELVLSANTWEQCLAAEQALREWMSEHPTDYGMLAGGEQLTLIKESIREEQQADRRAAAA